MTATWLLVAIGTLLGVHLALLALAVRRASGHPVTGLDPDDLLGGTGAETGESPERGSAGHGTRTVQCRECGATNETEYRYCRACVSELPAGVSLTTTGSDGESRRTI